MEKEKVMEKENSHFQLTAWKVSKYAVFSGPYFPVFGPNMEIYGVNLRIADNDF